MRKRAAPLPSPPETALESHFGYYRLFICDMIPMFDELDSSNIGQTHATLERSKPLMHQHHCTLVSSVHFQYNIVNNIPLHFGTEKISRRMEIPLA